MEDVNGAVVSDRLSAAEGVASATTNSTATAAATSDAVSQQWPTFPQQVTEGRQTHLDLQEQRKPRQGFPDLWQNEQQQKLRWMISHAPQRRHSASEYFYQHQQLGSPPQKTNQQRSPTQEKSRPVQLTQRQQQQQICTSFAQPMQRRWPPSLPHPHFSKGAPLLESAVGRPAPLYSNRSAREGECTVGPQHHGSPGASSRNRSDRNTSSSSSNDARGCVPNSNSSLSTRTSSPGGGRTVEGSSWRNPGSIESNSLMSCTSSSARTSSCSSRPFLRGSASLDTLRLWSSAAFFPDEAEVTAAYQTDTEAVALEQAAAESAAAAAVRSAARAAAASAAAQREACAVAAESARGGSSPKQRQTAAAHVEAASCISSAFAGVTGITGDSRTGLAAAPPEPRTQRTRELVRGSTIRSGRGTLPSSPPAAEGASGEKRWTLEESVWAAEFVRLSAAGFVRDEDTAVLTLSPDLGQPTLPNVATAAAVVSTGLDASSPASAAVDAGHHPDTSVPCNASADAAACDAFADRAEAAAVAATPVRSSAIDPALASAQRSSCKADPEACPSAFARASAAVPPAAAPAAPVLLVPAVYGGAGDITTAALELPLAWTAEDERGACTPRSSCVRASPRSCHTSCSQEPEQQLHRQHPEKPKEQLQWKENSPMADEHDKQQTDENHLQQPPRQQQHVQHPQRQEVLPPQAEHRDVQEKQQKNQQRQLQHEQHPRVEHCRRPSQPTQVCHSLHERQHLLLDQLSVSMPSHCSGGADTASSESVCVEEQPSCPQQVLQQLNTLMSEQHESRSSQENTQTDQQEQNRLLISQEQQSQVVQHKQHPFTPHDLHPAETPRPEVQSKLVQQQDGPHELRPQQSTEQKVDEQQTAQWKQDQVEEEQKDVQQQQHEQRSPKQQRLPQRQLQETEAGALERGDWARKCCNSEGEQSSKEQAAALRELQHVVQQQQDQLHTLMHQQTLLLQQLLQRQPLAALPAPAHPGLDLDVGQLPHATVARNAAADSPAAGDATAATSRQQAAVPPPAVPTPSVTAPQKTTAARAPVADFASTAQYSKLSAAGTGNANSATSEGCCYTQDSGIENYEESDLCVSQQGRQQPERTQLTSETLQKHANQLQQDRQHALVNDELQTPAKSLLQMRQKELKEQATPPLLCVKQLLQDEPNFQQVSQQQISRMQEDQPASQNTTLQQASELRDKQQHHLLKERLNTQQLRRSQPAHSSTQEGLHSSSLILQQPMRPVVSPPLMLELFDQLSALQGKACAGRVALAKQSPAGAAEGEPAAAASEGVPTTPRPATATAATVTAAACATKAPVAAAQSSTPPQASKSRPAPTTAATGRNGKGAAQGGATAVSGILQQQRDLDVSPLQLEQQQGRCESTPADAATLRYHTVPRGSSNTNAPLVAESSFSRLSTDTGSQQQAHDQKEQWSPLLLQQHDFSSLDCRRDKENEGTRLKSSIQVEFDKLEDAAGGGAVPVLRAADERVQQQSSLCTAELLKQQQWELQGKLRRLQERMQKLHQQQLQRERLQQQQVALDASLVSPQQQRATGTESPLQQQLPILLSNSSLHGVLQQQQCHVAQQRQQDPQHSFGEFSPKSRVLVHQHRNWSNTSSSGDTGLADSVGSANSTDAQVQQALSSAFNSGATGPFCPSFTAGARAEQGALPASATRLQYDQLLVEEAAPHATPTAAAPGVAASAAAAAAAATTTRRPVSKNICRMHAGHSATNAAATGPAAGASVTAPKEALAAFVFPGETRVLLSPASDGTMRVFPSDDPAAYAPGGARSAVAGPSLFVPAAPVPAVPPLAAADVSFCVHQYSLDQRQSDNADRVPLPNSRYSLAVMSPSKSAEARQVFSPAAGAAVRVGWPGQQQLLKYERGSSPARASGTGTTAGENGEDLGGRDSLCVSQPRLLQQVPLQRPPLLLHGLPSRMQQQISHEPAGVLPQQGHRRILDQDEQIVPSVLKRLLLQQQQAGRAEGDENSLFSSSLGLQQHRETCWWEEAASSKSPVKKQQRRRQGQPSRRLLTSQKQQLQHSKGLSSSRSDGTLPSTTGTRVQRSARLSSDRGATYTPAPRRQQAPQEKAGKSSSPALCCSALRASASNSGKRLSSSRSSHNIVSKQNSNHISRSNNCKSITSVKSSIPPATAYPYSPTSAKKNERIDDSRTRAPQQRHTSSRRDSASQSAAVPRAALASDFKQPRKKAPVKAFNHVHATDAAAVALPEDSFLLASPGTNMCQQTSLKFSARRVAAPGHTESPVGALVSTAAASQDLVLRKQLVDQDLDQSGSHDWQDFDKPENCGGVFLLTPHETSSSSGQRLQQHAGSPRDGAPQQAHSRDTSSFSEQEQLQREELNSSPPTTPRIYPFAGHKKVTADSNSDVDSTGGKSRAQLGRRRATLQHLESVCRRIPQAAEDKTKGLRAVQPNCSTRGRPAAAAADLLQSVSRCSRASRTDRRTTLSEEKSSEGELYEEELLPQQHPPPTHQQRMHACQRQSQFTHWQRASSPQQQQHEYLPSQQQHTRSQAQQQQKLPQRMPLENQVPARYSSCARLSDAAAADDDAAGTALRAPAAALITRQRSFTPVNSPHNLLQKSSSNSSKAYSTTRGLLCSGGPSSSSKTNAAADFASVGAAAASEGGAPAIITAYATAEAAMATTSRETAATLVDVSGIPVAVRRSPLHQGNELPQSVTATEHCVSLLQSELQHQRGSERATREKRTPHSSNSNVDKGLPGSPASSERVLRRSHSAQRLHMSSTCSAASTATVAKKTRDTLMTARTKTATASTQGKALPADDDAPGSISSGLERRQQSIAVASSLVAAASYSLSNNSSSSGILGENEEEPTVAECRQQHTKQHERQQVEHAQQSRSNQLQSQGFPGEQQHAQRAAQQQQQQQYQGTQDDPLHQWEMHEGEQRRKELELERHAIREVAEDASGKLSSGKALAASDDPCFRLLRFLKTPQSTRQPRGQETAALVQIFLSQQQHFAAAATATGPRRQRSTGSGIPYLRPESLFCAEQLKHLREDSAGDAHYVNTMARLLQRYEALTNVD